MKLVIDDETIHNNFSEGQIQGFMKDLNLSYFESVMYLWFYNHVGICARDLNQNLGRAMYIKFARGISKIIKEEQTTLS